MNQLQILNTAHKRAEKKALKEYCAYESTYQNAGVSLNDLYNRYLDYEFNDLEKACQLKPRLDELLKKYNINKPEKDLINKWCLITIRPEEIKSIHDFKICLLKALESKKIISWEMAFEQSGKTQEEIGKGAHAHILTQVQDYCTIKDILMIFKAPLKHYVYSIQVGNEHRKFIPDSIGLERAKNYIRGEKHNEAKEANVELDPIWRDKNNLLPLYTSPNQVQGSA